MAATGVTCSAELVAEYEMFKKSSNTLKFIVCKIEDGKVVLEHKSEDEDYQKFIELLPENDGRFCVYKCKFTLDDDRVNEKLVFISWVPDTCKARIKMTYAGTKLAVKTEFQGLACDINATDMSEIAYEEILRQAKKFQA